MYKNALRDTFESWSEERLDAEVDKFISEVKNKRPSHGKSGTNAADVDIVDDYNKPDEDDIELEGPNDDDINEENYRTTFAIDVNDDEDAESLSDYIADE